MNKVTNYREISYDIDTKIKALHWDEFITEVKCTWFDEGEYYAVYENLDEEDDHDRKKYAVYSSSTGELFCLIADSGLVLDACYDDWKYRDERNKLYKQIAMLAGWPEKMPVKNRYTVRIQRVVDVEVRAVSEEQAREIGRKIARDIDSKCMNTNLNCDYEVAEVWDAPPEDEGVWDLSLNAGECEQLLNEED